MEEKNFGTGRKIKRRGDISGLSRKLLIAGLLTLNSDSITHKSNENPEQRLERAKIEMKTHGITSEQRLAYITGLSEAIYKGVTPYGYSPTAEQVISDLEENIKDPDHRIREMYKEPREDAWSLYLGLPQKFDTFAIFESTTSQQADEVYGG